VTKEKINAICNIMADVFSCYEKYLYCNSWFEEIAYLSKMQACVLNIELILLSKKETDKTNGDIVGVNYKVVNDYKKEVTE
jgi:hypothetical protein